jgi:ferritin-like metal-binding protein YciE
MGPGNWATGTKLAFLLSSEPKGGRTANMAKTKTLEDVLIEELKDLYDAEKQLTRALPKMAKSASAPELKAAIQEHLEVTKGQVQRLEQVFEQLGKPARGKPCQAMKGLVAEGQEVMGEDMPKELLDVALIGAAQRVEHYEMAGYGTVRTLAQTLGHRDVAQLLEQTLREEEETDKKLTMIAKKYVNVRAKDLGTQEEE